MGKNPLSANPSSGNEELHAAARSGDLKAVQAICSANPLAVNSRDRHSRTPLHLAAWSGHSEVVYYLCKNKADVGAAAMDDMSSNRKGMTALHYAAQGSNLELVKYLLKKGANKDLKNKAGNTAVDLASSEEIRKILVEYESSSSKVALNGKEKGENAETKISSREKVEGSDSNADLHGDETVEEDKDGILKRKGEEEPKKTKR
ncbi:UNVERIFIED_CONTAM: hypothetical protein Scaly_0878000 [Sesamum calycinum]|uniref:Uncharacterized protein n=1 Tax=Sesamum calycinum TaxID=2727403 RepID=A0AAW2QWD1_9LAMI